MAWTNENKSTTTFDNDDKYQYLLKDDYSFLLKDDGGLIEIETSVGSEVFVKESKNSSVFINENRN